VVPPTITVEVSLGAVIVIGPLAGNVMSDPVNAEADEANRSAASEAARSPPRVLNFTNSVGGNLNKPTVFLLVGRDAYQSASPSPWSVGGPWGRQNRVDPRNHP
jgi:hypothetical protein